MITRSIRAFRTWIGRIMYRVGYVRGYIFGRLLTYLVLCEVSAVLKQRNLYTDMKYAIGPEVLKELMARRADGHPAPTREQRAILIDRLVRRHITPS